jgi:hypothetical protein
VRNVLRCCLVAALIVSLVEAPVMAAPSAALGVVMQADRASLRLAPASNGATLFDGDTLSTQIGGTLRLRVGSAQLFLLADSAAALHRTAETTSAALQRGTIVLMTSGPEAIELQASEARIRPRNGNPSLCQVTLVSPQELLLTSQRGELEVTIDEETHTVSEATSYRVLLEPEPQGPRGSKPRHAARNKFLLIALIGIGVGTGIGIWRALISPDKP